MESNKVDHATKAGLVIGDDPSAGSATANNITVENNSFNNNGMYGIEFYGRFDTNSIHLINNEVEGNVDNNVSYQAV